MEVQQEETDQGSPSRGRGASSKEKKSMLSMLAEVASATLTTPDAKNQAPMGQLSVDQLKSLNSTQLVELFAVKSIDEAKKKYSYTCKMLRLCNVTFTSHGSEVRARQQMSSHLTEHLEEINRNVGDEEGHCIVETGEAIEMEHEVHHQDGQEEGHMMEQMEVVEEIVETGEEGIQVIHESGEQILDAVYEVEEQGHMEESHEVHEEHQQVLEEVTYEDVTGRRRRNSESSATMSASEQEDLEPEIISQEDGEVYFKPRRKMDPCEQGAQDWSQLEQMIDHTYTHPCGPPELPRQKPTTLRVHVDENGDNSLSQEVSKKQTRLTIPTALWPSVYTPLLPNISQIQEVSVEPASPAPPPPPAPTSISTSTPSTTPVQTRIVQPMRTQYIIQGNTVTHQMPQQQKSQMQHVQVQQHQQQQIQVQVQPQLVHVQPRTSHIDTISTPTSTSIRPIRVQHQQQIVSSVTTTPTIITSTSTPVSSGHQVTPQQVTCKPAARNRVMFEDENGILYEYEESVLDESSDMRTLSESGSGDVAIPQPGTMHIVVDPETGQEYAVEYQTDSEALSATGNYEETPGTSGKHYDIQMVEDVMNEDGVVVYEEAGEIVEGDESGVVAWPDEEVAEQEVSTNFSPFDGKIVYHAAPSPDINSKVVRAKGSGGRPGRNLRLTINQIHVEQMQAVNALVDGSDAPQNPKMHNGRVIPGWERQMALSCLKALSERTEPDFVLQCKICNNNKTFTAAATLISHYRSHAGIKPFTCSTCNATFTRQHSLKYHMLIHNNASRFTCHECNRQFRHPSHFKEHLRRHTGETPFECVDCEQRFKTRNTYKRHLKTRHNKLLSKEGIAELALDYADAEDVSEMVVIEEGYEEEEIV